MKKGFSLIELVFAIVIIGISVSVLPRIIQQSQSSNEFAIKQELIFHAKSMMTRIMQGAWDSGHVLIRCQQKNPACAAGSADLNSTDFNPIPIYNIALPGGSANERIGIITADILEHNRIEFDKGVFAPTAKANFGTASYGGFLKNDIDDWDGVSFIITSAADSGDFIYNVNLSIAVDYIDQSWSGGNHRNSRNITKELDTVSPGATNIKRVTITARNVTGDAQSVSIFAYFSNIGQANFNKTEWK